MTGTRTKTGTPTRTKTITQTRTLTVTPTVTRSQTRTPSVTATRTTTITRTPSLTRTQTRTATITLTPSVTRTPTITRTRTITRTPTPTPRPGADVTFVGVAQPFGPLTHPVGITPEGYPIFERILGYNFMIVIEGNAPNRRQIGSSAFKYDPGNPAIRPDLEIIVSRALGNGSRTVCDSMPPVIGGVPDSPSFDFTQPISNAINDLACRFIDGSGQPVGRGMSGDACTSFPDGEFHFANPDSRMQFCTTVDTSFAFPLGETTVMVRLRDSNGVPGPPAAFVIRVLP